LETGPDRRFFRIVMGGYDHVERHCSARDELRSCGLCDDQICSFGSRLALNGVSRREGYRSRRIRQLEIRVSPVALFDQFWPERHHDDGSLTHWMTPAQSIVVWRKLCDHCAFLMVSAESEQQQIQSSQIQLRHGPAIVQAFNFAV
jgi:hypothetical protein